MSFLETYLGVSGSLTLKIEALGRMRFSEKKIMRKSDKGEPSEDPPGKEQENQGNVIITSQEKVTGKKGGIIELDTAGWSGKKCLILCTLHVEATGDFNKMFSGFMSI